MGEVTRRDLLCGGLSLALSAASPAGTAGAAGRLPRRPLGRTGVDVPVLALGTAPMGRRLSVPQAVNLVNHALDSGVTWLDTAPEAGGYGRAQEQLGHVVPERRRETFLATKLFEPDRDRALRLLETSLRELRVDSVDLLYAHNLGADQMAPEKVLGPDGTMAALLRARELGLTRFIGLTGHNRPIRFLRTIARYDVDVMMNAVNFVDRYTYDFEGTVWPAAARRGIGLVAMKVFGGVGQDPWRTTALPREELQTALRYALGLPGLSCALIGMSTPQELMQLVGWVKDYRPFSEEEAREAERVGSRLAAQLGRRFGPVV